MEYNFREIEKKWQQWWADNEVYKVKDDYTKPKYYVLDMFPYPSGAGLHVGHPLGYIASDIYARYKRLKGFNVLHPMGYDAFGLPAEQYAIEHGVHPADSTKQNIENFRSQLDKIGFSFDWSREVNTSDVDYYHWTQWIFFELFNSYFNRQTKKAQPIEELVQSFKEDGTKYNPCPGDASVSFTADEWKSFDEKQQQNVLMKYRLAYSGYGEVNWCEALGTVLANDEVINGVSERGGYPVIKKKLRQWYLRITEYADRLLEGLETVDFSDAMKEMQTNWIGKSYGAEINFEITTIKEYLKVFTTRPDTIFGVDFMVIAPEHELVKKITTEEQKKEVENYIIWVKSRSDRERMAEKNVSGAFTGAYAINPFNRHEVPIYISEYVLAGYGTGAIMAVPCGDERDFKFAQYFDISITNILGDRFNGKEANPTKEGEVLNSDFLTGMLMKDAMKYVVNEIEGMGYGNAKVNYKMRDAAFSRQRYWGEPFPIVWKDGIAYPLDESELPLVLPKMDEIKPGSAGEGPLSLLKEWALIPDPSPQVEKGAFGAANVPKYSVYTPVQYELAKQMRKDYTEAEDKLWQALKGNKLGVKFRRQHPVDAYIVDFIALQNKLIVEVDGGYHKTEDQQKYDENRTAVLNEIGFNIIRFNNEEVIHQLPAVLKKIKDAMAANVPLSTRGEGLGVRETSTMPGYAGSSWYFLRYADPHNEEAFADKEKTDYWNQVDLYVGGTEHAVGHLLYSRMWTKFLCDRGYISFDEPFKKLLNQGMIQGSSRFVYRVTFRLGQSEIFCRNDEELKSNQKNIFISLKHYEHYTGLKNSYKEINAENYITNILPSKFLPKIDSEFGRSIDPIRIDVSLVDGVQLNMQAFRNSKQEYNDAIFICEDSSINIPLSFGEGSAVRSNQAYICGTETEKMSKSKLNTVNPNDIVEKYGADTFRMYEMFLGPVEQSKPWDTKGIEGIHRFLKKLWRLFYDDQKRKVWTNEKATDAELKILHKTIKKTEEDTERFSFNTAVSTFMVAVNELTDLRCNKKEILEPLIILLAPYAPHIAEELYTALQNEASNKKTSVLNALYPKLDKKYLVETSKEYPVSINGKLRTTLNFPLDAVQKNVEERVMQNDIVLKWTEGKPVKKIVFVKGKMINVVI